MNKHLIATSIVLVFVVIVSLVGFRAHRKSVYELEDGKEGGSRLDLSSEISLAREGSVESKSENLLGRNQKIEAIRDLGYQFSADRVRGNSAEGNVVVVTPEGVTMKSESIVISSDAENIYLKGDIILEGESEKSAFKMKYTGDKAFAKISLNGDSMVFEGEGVIYNGSKNYIESE